MTWLYTSPAQASIWFVKVDSSASNTGTTWANATSFHKALRLAQAGDQVWLAAGLYFNYPWSVFNADPTEAQFQFYVSRSYRIPSGVKVYGHFAGDEATLDQRHGAETHLYCMPFVYHAVVFKNVAEGTLLDGVRIEASTAPIDGDDGLVTNGSTSLRTTHVGREIINYASDGISRPTVTNCKLDQAVCGGAGAIIGNIADGGSGLAALRVIGCMFVNLTGTKMVNSAVMNRSYDGAKADLLLYNTTWSRVDIIPNYAPYDNGLSTVTDMLSALIVNVESGNPCRIINCRFEDVGIYPGSPAIPLSAFYLIANLRGATSDMVNCQVTSTHASHWHTDIGLPAGFTPGVTLSHCIMNGVSNLATLNLTTIQESGHYIHRYGDVLYGCPSDPVRHLVNLADGSPTVAACNTLLTDQGDNTLLERWSDLVDIPGLADRVKKGRIDIGPDETNPNVYLQTTTGISSLTVGRNTATVMLLGKYCDGTVNWSGSSGVSGTGSSIPVSTSLTGSFVYQATCTTNNCISAPSSVTVAVIALPDLSPTLSLPQANFSASGPEASRQFVVNVFEVGGKTTSMGSVTLTLSAPTGYSLTFNSSLTSINVSGGTANPVAVDNGKWTVWSNVAGQQLRLVLNPGQSIDANGQSVLGFTLSRTTANSGSVSNMTVNVADDPGGSYDGNPANNVYARILNGL